MKLLVGGTAALITAFHFGCSDTRTFTNMRGERFCELLLANVSGGDVHVDVYSSFGLNDCPDAAWSSVDTTTLASQVGATEVVANGPRFWTVDSLTGSPITTATRTLAGIEMREGAAIDMPLSAAASIQTPYLPQQVERTADVTFLSGSTVYELTDPSGNVYAMESYSTQKDAQSEATLANLDTLLTPPPGWSFSSRVLSANLSVSSVNGTATVLQDDYDNAYQRLP